MKIRKLKKSRKVFLLHAMIASICMMVAISLAWYMFYEKRAESANLNVMQPYYLTLLEPNAADELILSVGGLYQGQTKEVMFCVSNRKNEESGTITTGSEFDFEMEFVFTKNLPLVYNVYDLEECQSTDAGAMEVEREENGATAVRYYKKTGTVMNYHDVSAERRAALALDETSDWPNLGYYQSYTADNNPGKLHLSNGTAGTTGYDEKYYLVEIMWNSTTHTFEQYEKETDMLYVLVKALQPKPQKKNP